MPNSQRADARRNYTRILAVAQQEVAANGANASLEQIARTAGVGSATVRRHFPTRQALLEAVSQEQIEALRIRAESLATGGEGDSRNGATAGSRTVRGGVQAIEICKSRTLSPGKERNRPKDQGQSEETNGLAQSYPSMSENACRDSAICQLTAGAREGTEAKIRPEDGRRRIRRSQQTRLPWRGHPHLR